MTRPPCPICDAPLPARQTRGRVRCPGCGANWRAAELRRGGQRDRTDPYQGRLGRGIGWQWRKRAVTD